MPRRTAQRILDEANDSKETARHGSSARAFAPPRSAGRRAPGDARRRRERADAPLRRGRHGRRRASRRLARDPARPPHGRDGPVRLREVHPDAHPRRPRQADQRLGRDRRRGADDAQGQRPDEASAPAYRLRLPVLQPLADALRRGEHHAAAVDLRHEGRARLARGAARGDRARRSPQAPPVRALGRPAAARRRRARARLAADGALRRRADGQPRLADLRRDPRPAPRRGRDVRPDDGDGHPRPEGRHDRRPDPLPRRRPDRQGARSLDAGRDPGGSERSSAAESRDEAESRFAACSPASSARRSPPSRSSSASRWSAARSS